ncbi:helix-turn-helix domain-containing protein [Streptomyces sp. enrichment culture]|uniref:helix-turn-helix domain-containing protein n=1 Tax=Streptomyces sp. enrichment culture TaxID=1795815 RepID=UPI003F56864A
MREGPGRVDLRHWMTGIAAIASAVNRPASLPELLDLVAETAGRLMGYEFCAVLLPDRQRDVLVIAGSHGLSRDYVDGINSDHPVVIQPGASAAPSSRAYLTRQPLQVGDISTDPAFVPWGEVAREQGYHSMISIPLIVADQVLGTLNCYTRAQHHFTTEEVDLLTTLADQAATALTTARWRAAEARKLEDLRRLNESLEEQHRLLRQGEEIHQRLTGVALRAEGVAAVARALSELLSRPVLIEDPAGSELAAVPYDNRVPQAPGPDAREDEELSRLLDSVLPRGRPVEVPSWEGATRDAATVLVPVALSGEVVARIWLTGSAGRLGPLDHRALEQASTVLCLEILRTRAALEVEWRVAGELVTDLVTANQAVLGTASARAERLGHDLSTPHAVLVLRDDSGEGRRISRVLNVVRSVAQHVRPLPMATTMGDYTVVLWPVVDPSADDLLRAAERIGAAVRRAQADAHLRVAVSPLCHTLSDYPRAFRIARGALDISELLRSPERTVTLETLGVHGLLLQLEDTGELVRFASNVLDPLRAHDAARNTDLVETLAAYLRHDLSTARTAESLYVHPNTVALRIRRIESLLGKSFARAEDLVDITMALMVERVARSSGT